MPVLGVYAALRTTLLHMKRIVKTESPIFILLCFLCFQNKPFRFLLTCDILKQQGLTFQLNRLKETIYMSYQALLSETGKKKMKSLLAGPVA